MSVGLGIRPELFEHVAREKPEFGFLEAHSENYFGESISRAKLLELREHYDISLHGVGLSLGRADDLNSSHLNQLQALVAEVQPKFVSEHLAWSAYAHRHIPDLLPLPLSEQSLAVMCEHIDQMQEALGLRILIENPSNYLLFDRLQIPETEFLNLLAARTGCGLLVDVNNIYVSSTNLERNPMDYLQALNSQFIFQYHLAGFTPVERGGETVLVDTHNHTVYPEVWELFNQALSLHGARDTLIEWDSDFPEFAVLENECRKAQEHISAAIELDKPSELTKSIQISDQRKSNKDNLNEFQDDFLNQLISGEENFPHAIDNHSHRIWVYQNNTRGALLEYLQEVFPAVQGVVGEEYFKLMVDRFVTNSPPQWGNIHLYGELFASVIEELEGLRTLPYLADLIDLEWAMHQSYFASLGTPLIVGEYSQEELLSASVLLNESVTMVESVYPLEEIYRQSLPGFVGKVAIDLAQSSDSVLVYKQGYRVQRTLLDEGSSLFLRVLKNSENLLQAIEGASGSIGAESVSKSLVLVFELGLLTEI